MNEVTPVKLVAFMHEAEERKMMTPEIYKGIEFIRIANLPEEQKKQISATLDRTKIIKILKDKELVNDCVQTNDYKDWLSKQFVPAPKPVQKAVPVSGKLITSLSN